MCSYKSLSLLASLALSNVDEPEQHAIEQDTGHRKKRTSIGVKFEGALFADNVYRATFKESLDNEK